MNGLKTTLSLRVAFYFHFSLCLTNKYRSPANPPLPVLSSTVPLRVSPSRAGILLFTIVIIASVVSSSAGTPRSVIWITFIAPHSVHLFSLLYLMRRSVSSKKGMKIKNKNSTHPVSFSFSSRWRDVTVTPWSRRRALNNISFARFFFFFYFFYVNYYRLCRNVSAQKRTI